MTTTDWRRSGARTTLVPLVVDVALPRGVTLVVSHLGCGTVVALTAGAVIPLLRTAAPVLSGRSLNRLAALMLATSVVGIGAGLLVGDPRFVVAKDGVISAAIAVGLLLSTRRGTPIMSAGLLPFVTRGDAAEVAAWHRLAGGSPAFRRLERRYTATWGWVLLTDCAVRAVGAFVVPDGWLTWFGGAVTITAIVVAALLSGILTVDALTRHIDQEVAA